MIAWVRLCIALSAFVPVASAAVAQQPFITVASTTSTEESGLFGYLLPEFTKATGIQRLLSTASIRYCTCGNRGIKVKICVLGIGG